MSVRDGKCARLRALVLRLAVLGQAVLLGSDCDMGRGESGDARLSQRVCVLIAGRAGVARRRGLSLLRRAASLAHSTARLCVAAGCVEALRGSRLRGSRLRGGRLRGGRLRGGRLRGGRLRGGRLVLFCHWLGARLAAALERGWRHGTRWPLLRRLAPARAGRGRRFDRGGFGHSCGRGLWRRLGLDGTLIGWSGGSRSGGDGGDGGGGGGGGRGADGRASQGGRAALRRPRRSGGCRGLLRHVV